LLIYLVFRIVEPFLVPLAWSAVLAVFFYPVHEWMMRRVPPNRAALASTLGVTLLLIAPALIVLVYTTRQAIDATAQLQEALTDPDRALGSHAVAWIRHQLPQAWQNTDFSQPLRQGA
jgi:predicted PurR-regulated permease PerM